MKLNHLLVVFVVAITALLIPRSAMADESSEAEDVEAHIREQEHLVRIWYGPATYEEIETKTMYSTSESGVYEEPDESSTRFGTSLVNTEFEVVEIADGWARITTANGFAYIKEETLSEEQVKTYSERELYLMAHLLAGEAQFCSDAEQRYVGSVALNRTEHPAFPDTLESVIFQKGQYACVRDGNFYREPTQSNWDNARYLLENGSVLPAHVVWQSGSRQGEGVYLKTKYHYYCY